MAENPATQESTTPSPAVAQNTEPPAQSTQESTIPKSRFDEVNQRAKAAQAELDRIKAEQAAAAEAADKASGKWQELADKREVTINTLEPKLKAAQERADRLGKVLAEHITTLLKDAPDFVREAIKDREPDAQLDYINKYHDKWAPEGTQPPPRGAGPGPRSVGSPGRDEQQRVLEAQMRASGRYPRI